MKVCFTNIFFLLLSIIIIIERMMIWTTESTKGETYTLHMYVYLNRQPIHQVKTFTFLT